MDKIALLYRPSNTESKALHGFITGITAKKPQQQATAGERLNTDDDTFRIKNGILMQYKARDRIVRVPEGVESIAQMAFSGLSWILGINLPTTLRNIENYAFSNCASLTDMTIPGGVTQISPYTFYSCRNLDAVHLPIGTLAIGRSAFEGCTILRNINIPRNVYSICPHAFESCESLRNLVIPAGIRYIGRCAFHRCTSLANVCYDGTREQWSKVLIEEGAFPPRTALHFFNLR